MYYSLSKTVYDGNTRGLSGAPVLSLTWINSNKAILRRQSVKRTYFSGRVVSRPHLSRERACSSISFSLNQTIFYKPLPRDAVADGQDKFPYFSQRCEYIWQVEIAFITYVAFVKVIPLDKSGGIYGKVIRWGCSLFLTWLRHTHRTN